MVARLSDDPEEGCASDGLALVAESSEDFEDIFSEIAADVTRLRLLNWYHRAGGVPGASGPSLYPAASASGVESRPVSCNGRQHAARNKPHPSNLRPDAAPGPPRPPVPKSAYCPAVGGDRLDQATPASRYPPPIPSPRRGVPNRPPDAGGFPEVSLARAPPPGSHWCRTSKGEPP